MAVRYGSPSRVSTPGDLAPLALAPLQPNGTTRSPTKRDDRVNRNLPQPPPLPTWSSQLLPSAPGIVGELHKDTTEYELRLRSLGARQDGLEQRLFQLAELFASITDEQAGQARRMADLSAKYDYIGKRFDEIQSFRNFGKKIDDVSTKMSDNSTLTQFRATIDCHTNRLFLLSNIAGRYCLYNPANPSNDDPLRKALLQWHSLTKALSKASRHEANTKKERAFDIQISEIGGRIEDIEDRLGRHDVRLARIDAAVQDSRTTTPTKNHNRLPHATPFSTTVEALEMLSDQAKTVDNLDFLVREELRISQQQPSNVEAKVTERLTDCVSEQGRAICELRDVLKSIASRIEGRLQNGTTFTKSNDLVDRVSSLEDKMVSIQQHVGVFASIVRQIRDHAADALDDRLVTAMTEMQEKLSANLASIHNRIRLLQGNTTSAIDAHHESHPVVFTLGGNDQQRQPCSEELHQASIDATELH